MSEDWALALGVLSAIFTFCILLTQYYSRVHVPRRKDKEQKREQIYKPIIRNVDALVEAVKEKKEFREQFNWKTVEGKVSRELYKKLQKLFEEKVDIYHKWLKHNRDFIRFQGSFYLDSSLPELEGEFRKLGAGKLEYELYNSIITSLLQGKKITLKLLEDSKPDFFHNLAKCPNHKELKKLLDWLNEDTPAMESLREAEQDLLKYADELKIELKKF